MAGARAVVTALEDGAWLGLRRSAKLKLADQLREAIAKTGEPVNPVDTPGELALKHEPNLNVQRAHLLEIDAALRWVHETPHAKLMIWTPPRAGKSWRVSRWFPFWWLTLHPADQVVLASYASSLAEGHAAACRDFIIGYGGEYGLQLKSDEQTRADWALTTGGGMRARGVRSGLTGFGLDVGVVDDPFRDRAEADSPVIREAVWEWYSSAFASRKSPEAREIHVNTRWHQQDLSGRLLQREGRLEDGGEWKVLHLPAIALPADVERGIYPDPLEREPGAPLPHPKIIEGDTTALLAHWDRQRASSTARDWGAMYQGTPFDATGGLLTEADITAATQARTAPIRRSGVGVDPSGGGRDTAGIVGGAVDDTGKLWWTHDRTGNMTADKWAEAACVLADEIDADMIVVEINYGGDQATTLIRQAWKALQTEGRIPRSALCPRIVGVHSRKSKTLRAEPIAQAVKTQRAWFDLSGNLRTLTGEFVQWEAGSTWSPGALDAAVHLAYALLPTLPAGATVTSVAGRRRDDARPRGVASRRAR